MREVIDELLQMNTFAVFGASDDPESPGFHLVQSLADAGRCPFPINPRIAKVRNMRCYGTLDELPGVPQVVVITLPPEMALEVVRSAIEHGVRRFWLQPGSESPEVLSLAEEHGVMPVHSHCLMEQLEARS